MFSRFRIKLWPTISSSLVQKVVFFLCFWPVVFGVSLVVNEVVFQVFNAISWMDPKLTVVPSHLMVMETMTVSGMASLVFLFGLSELVPRIKMFTWSLLVPPKNLPFRVNVRIDWGFFVIFVIGLLFFAGFGYDAKTQKVRHIAEDYGSFLGVVAFLLTIAGLYFSVIAMRDLRNVINTFEEFSSRFSIMLTQFIPIEFATNPDSDPPNRDPTDFVRIMAYTPLPGALALRKDDYNRLVTLISNARNVEVTCLEEKCLGNWMKGFDGKKTRDGYLNCEKICDAVKEAKGQIERLRHPPDNAGAKKKEFAAAHPVRLAKDKKELPQFFAYFTNDRAIVINPLFFPIDADKQPDELKKQTVELIGFETTDIHTVRNLQSTYIMVRKQIEAREEEEKNKKIGERHEVQPASRNG
jgi:hypothetical protein